ncbi:CsgG/HfaB family protein [Chryseobacterium taihuense]|uniref:Curli production assembly/transport component CsgG n=1 Tax=Chryseobacterium taihuense TaxID=1141221 RepID=A0ABY0QRH0_9FLAO|nr:CsgG/HfaB family protein [Chryseobacterium taihuense]SDL62528.1 curli production assembly/transport component CsgG [Chryseobacterium taihuense]
MKNLVQYPKFWVTILLIFLVLNSCSTLFNLPTDSERSTLGEVTQYTSKIKNLPLPNEKIVVGVYKFRDQTGQYKPSETGANWSTAIPQGTTTILLKALEDSKWFTPIERENIGNLLNERQIIRTTRKEYMPNQSNESGNLPPLLYAGIILEGGVISYDSNIMTGGVGARYFGIGASTQYRQDRITVYLRAVSTQSGEILKTVYTSKTILSTSVNGSFFRYVDTERLFEAEAGFTQNEPVQLAVTEAIEKAVHSLIVEGVRDKVWSKRVHDPNKFTRIIEEYNAEQNKNNDRLIGDKFPVSQRGKSSLFVLGEGTQIKGDYANPKMNIGGKTGFKYFITDHLNAEANVGYLTFENDNIYKANVFTTEANIEYLFFPKYKVTPYLYGGLGSLFFKSKNEFKMQLGGGIEYLFSKSLAVRLGTQYDFGFNDGWDEYVGGKRNDQSIRIGLGLNWYISNRPFKKN